MNLYLISQDKRNGYDTYDSAIVAAPDPLTAATIHPEEGSGYTTEEAWEDSYYVWAARPNEVDVEYLGIAKDGTKQGVILSSFNAG